MSENSKFTKREWVHLIVTLSIIQAFIWWVSFQFSGNSSALGYVSFAGTLISIILAVLAIGYTYGESQQQKNSSETLAGQINSLVKIKDKLEIQAEALDNINILKSSLDEFSKKVYSHLESSQKGFEDFKKDFGKSNKNVKKPEFNEDFNEAIVLLFKAATPFNKISLIMLILYTENRNNENRENVDMIEMYTYLNNLNLENFAPVEEHRVFGGMATWFQVLNRIGELSVESSYVSPELINIFNDYVNKPSNDFLQSFDGGAHAVLKLAKTSNYYSPLS